MDYDAPAADFETAIEACGFGLFNIILIIISLIDLTAMVFSSAAMSYILPIAECDLQLTLFEKGCLNAASYGGMIISAIPWGFIADTFGRKQVLIWGSWFDTIFVLCASFSQTSTQLMIFKFLDGFTICGPYAVLMSYTAEFHGSKHRPFVMMSVGLSICIGTLILAVIAYYQLPQKLIYRTVGLSFNTWQLFVGYTSIPSFLGGLFHIFLPESPKFLMSHGRYARALKSFQKVYAINKLVAKNKYPIKNLFDEIPDRSLALLNIHNVRRSSIQDRMGRARMRFVAGLQQLKPMFTKPYLSMSLRVYVLHFCLVMGMNCIRLWMPQIFATMNTFELRRANDTSMCAVLTYNAKRKKENFDETKQCVNEAPPDAYINNILVALIILLGFFIACFFTLKLSGLTILRIALLVSCICVGALYWSNTANTTLILASVYLTLLGISATVVIGLSVNMFPTLMRTMVVIIIMSCGRLGSISGNLLFPIFISRGCIAPFVWLCSVIGIAFLFSLFLTVHDKETLK